MYTAHIVVGFLYVIMTSAQNTSTHEYQRICQNVSASCNSFSGNFYKHLTSNGGNIVCSPVGLHITLSLISNGSEDGTLDEFKNVLHLNDINAMHEEFKLLMSALNDVKEVDLRLANALYIKDGFKLLTEFLSLSTDVFHSSISQVDFKNSAEAANTINTWIEKATEKKILNVVSADAFDESTSVVLVNAIYFKGNWLNQFKTDFTEDRSFFVTKTQEKHVPTMFKSFKYPHGRLPEIQARFVEIPYLNKDFVMVIILPNEIDGLQHVESNFNWNDILKAPRSQSEVHLYLPKFKIELMMKLEDILLKMGLSKMFGDNAEFGRLSDVPLKVSSICQKAFIEVNEEGAEAAAATVMEIRVRRAISIPEEFNVNHPFMFSILHKPSGLPLFLGSIRDIQTPSVKDEL